MMVTGGYGAYYSVELLYITGVHLCFLPDLPLRRRQHTQTGLQICGGDYGSAQPSCITFKGINEIPWNTMNAS